MVDQVRGRVWDRELHDVAVPQPGLVQEAQWVADHRRSAAHHVGAAGPGRSEIHASILPPGCATRPRSQLDARVTSYVMLPGIYSSGPTHWRDAARNRIDPFVRFEPPNWDEPDAPSGSPHWTAVASAQSPGSGRAQPVLPAGPDVGRRVGHACRGGVPESRRVIPPPGLPEAADEFRDDAARTFAVPSVSGGEPGRPLCGCRSSAEGSPPDLGGGFQ